MSGSHVPGSQVPRPRISVTESQGPTSQGHRVPGPRVSSLRVSGSWVSGLRVPGPGSQVLILDYATFLTSLKKIEEFLFLRNKKVIHIKKRRKSFTLLSLFCLHQNSKNRKVTGNIIHNSK